MSEATKKDVQNNLQIEYNEIVMKGKCKKCGKLLDDSLLTHCSSKCQFEDYLNSKSISHTPIDTEADLT